MIAFVLENLDLTGQFALLGHFGLIDRVRERALNNTAVVPSASVTWFAKLVPQSDILVLLSINLDWIVRERSLKN